MYQFTSIHCGMTTKYIHLFHSSNDVKRLLRKKIVDLRTVFYIRTRRDQLVISTFKINNKITTI